MLQEKSREKECEFQGWKLGPLHNVRKRSPLQKQTQLGDLLFKVSLSCVLLQVGREITSGMEAFFGSKIIL